MAGKFEGLSPRALCLRLKQDIPSISESILDKILEHKIDGEVFLSLNDENLREIAPLLGDRLKIKRVISETVVKLNTPPSSTTSPNSPLTGASEKYASTPSLGSSWMCARRSLIDTSADSRDDSPTPTPPSTLSSAVLCTDSDVDSLGMDSSVDVQQNQELPVGREKDEDSVAERFTEEDAPDCEKPSKSVEPKADWAEGLVLPTRFSNPTTKAIETGVLTKGARAEIVHSLSTLMLLHTSRPTPHDLDTISRRLIEKYPKLRDTVDKGYGSWRSKLRTKFKNLRRPNRAQKAGITVPPPPKRSKLSSPTSASPSASDAAEYDRHVGFLQRSFASKKWSMASMLTLLEETAELRRAWICDENPSVSQILEKFPCFLDSRIMLNEFCSLTGADESRFKENWEEYERLVFKYAPLEQKKSVKNLMSQYLAEECDNADRTSAYTLDLLSALLCTNRSSGQSFISIFEGESVDIDECIGSLNTKAPCIAAFGITRDDIADVKVIVETDNILPVTNLSTAIHFCFACYYVFNISYPPCFKNILLFLEKYVYGLKSSLKLPMSVVLLHDGLERVRDT